MDCQSYPPGHEMTENLSTTTPSPCKSSCEHMLTEIQRQTVVSQFFQLDRLVVEGGKSVCSTVWGYLDTELTKYRASKADEEMT